MQTIDVKKPQHSKKISEANLKIRTHSYKERDITWLCRDSIDERVSVRLAGTSKRAMGN